MLKPDEAGPVVGEHEKLAQRESFGKWLPIEDYDEESRAFFNSDNTIGYAWECKPLTFVDANGLDILTGLLRQDFTQDTVLQFILVPEERIGGILERYLALKTRDTAMAKEAAGRYASHLLKGISGLDKMRGIPVRQFRLVVTIKSKVVLGPERLSNIEENLTQARLAPRRMNGGDMMDFLRQRFNKVMPDNARAYCEGKKFRNQVIGAEYPIETLNGMMKVGGRFATCLTPKSLPRSPDSLNMNRLIGGFMGNEDDTSQLTNPFIWTSTIFFHVTKESIKRKANTMMAQRAGGSIAKTIGHRVGELDWVLDDIENTPYVNIICSMWVFGEDVDDLNRGAARVRNLWEKQDFVMQRETSKGILQAMFITALPFGLYASAGNISTLDRDFPLSCSAAARLLPVQADFAGYMEPKLLYVGRKGGLVSVDVFDKRANNYNWLGAAGSGAGKSFQTNFLVDNYHGAGALIRCVDIGYSYEKQCLAKKGRFIDIGNPAHKVVLNPFASNRKAGESDDEEGDLQMTAKIVLLMAFSNTGTSKVTETHSTLAKDAVRFAMKKDGGERGVDLAYEFLQSYPKLAGGVEYQGAIPIAHELAFNLREFCTGGAYGHIFNGRSTFNIGSDEFVVLELEKLLTDAQLFSVISMQVINAITNDLYLSDRSQQRFMVFDEAWKYLGAGDVQVNTALIAGVIMEGYRRARKYGGSTGIITQSLLDLQKFGPVGEIIKANSAFKFLLESEDYAEAFKRGIVDYQGLLAELAKSIKNNKPHYSEILFETPFGTGVGRLCVDKWTYWMNAASGDEFSRFRQELHKGLDPLEALNKLAAET